MTQEFHISVTPVGQNDYLVRTEQVAPGVPLAEELVSWPVADWLTAAGHLMNDPLKSVLQGDAMVLDTNLFEANALHSVNLVALGQQFYNALFQGTLRDSWIAAQSIAQNQQQVLRLRLGLKDNKLARLPWEVMHAGDRPLATGPYIAFSRYQSGISAASRLSSNNMPIPTEEGGIRVLMAIASPTDQIRLNLLKQEAIKLQAELHRRIPRSQENVNYIPEIELTLLEQPGREELTQALEQGRYHILHYSGHSNLGANGGEIYLVSSRTGLTETLSGDDLAGLLVNNNIQMAVFNSCLGAYRAISNQSAETGERNLTESLVKRGIRSVLAMSERIPDEVALTLTQLFYRNLSQGYPVDLCVSRVRQGLISAYGSHQMYWALPILYLQPEFEGHFSPRIYTSEGTELFSGYNLNLPTTPTMYSVGTDEADMPLPLEEMIPPALASNSSELDDWFGEDTWGNIVDEIEYDDPGYTEDSAIVSDLFRELDNEKSGELVPKVEEDVQGRIPGDIAAFEDESPLWDDWDNSDFPPLPPQPQRHSNTTGKQLANSNYAFAPTESQSYANPGRTTIADPTNEVSSWTVARPNRRPRSWSKIGFVAAGLTAVVVGIGTWLNHHNTTSDIPQIPLAQPIPHHPQIDLRTAETGIVTAYATEKLSTGDLQAGLAAVEELLNRNVLPAVETALKLIPAEKIGDPEVNFFKGRLAWQSIQVGDKKYSVDDARRFWERAFQAKQDSLLYANALGFAYYAEGNLNRANDSWFKALNLAIKRDSTPKNTPVAYTQKITDRDTLTAYAGLALGLHKSAPRQPGDKREQYLNEAIKLRQMVMQDDPTNFQPDKLAINWLWTEKAIEDWRSLLKLRSRK